MASAIACGGFTAATTVGAHVGQPLQQAYTRALLPDLHKGVHSWGMRRRCFAGTKSVSGLKRRGVSVRAMSEESPDNSPPESPSKTEEELAALERALGRERVASTKVRKRRRQPRPERATAAKPAQVVKEEPKKKDLGPVETVREILYGEKGFLFWLNRLAYYAIFGVIGGWIVFRFVGPALGLYELVDPLGVPR